MALTQVKGARTCGTAKERTFMHYANVIATSGAKIRQNSRLGSWCHGHNGGPIAEANNAQISD